MLEYVLENSKINASKENGKDQSITLPSLIEPDFYFTFEKIVFRGFYSILLKLLNKYLNLIRMTSYAALQCLLRRAIFFLA